MQYAASYQVNVHCRDHPRRPLHREYGKQPPSDVSSHQCVQVREGCGLAPNGPERGEHHGADEEGDDMGHANVGEGGELAAGLGGSGGGIPVQKQGLPGLGRKSLKWQVLNLDIR